MKRLFILTGLLLLTGALFNRTIAQNRENQVREQSIKYQRLMAYRKFAEADGRCNYKSFVRSRSSFGLYHEGRSG